MTAPNRFRFRAWYSHDRSSFMCGPGDLKDFCDGYFEHTKLDRLIMMQSTGLTDKHGKEIFEGDILTWDGFTLAVDWFQSGAMFAFNNRPASTMIPVYMHNHRAEIIGNIYETPELLEAKC